MHPFFHVTSAQIQRLDDSQARELIARLCIEHLAREGLDTSIVFWGGNQRAKDDGVDVRVDGSPAMDIPGPLRRSAAVIQVKAEKFGPAKIKPEMAPGGKLRPAIAELVANHGLYLIASTRDDLADPARRSRIEAMRATLRIDALDDKIHVDFLGTRQIADWVERFPPVAIWVRSAIGAPLPGWKGYGPWAYLEEDKSAEFLPSSEPRVIPPRGGEPITDLDAINAIRRDLAAGKAVRLVGLSGVGKTRLAQALFDDRVKTDTPPLSPNTAIYTDISDSPSPTPERMIEALRATSVSTVLVVDNCSQQTHSALVEKKGRTSSSLGLLTIEYDIRDNIPDETLCYRLDGSSPDILRSLLRSHYPHLSDPDKNVVIAASGGNARLAFALASTSKQGGDLALLRNEELFKRLFEQTRGAGDELLRCAQAISLVYSFDGIDLYSGSELSLLSTFSGTTPEILHRNVAEIRRRGLLQERGKMRALLPHAVSNHLAVMALEEIPLGDLEQRLFTAAPTRIRGSLANRLSYLQASPIAKQLVTKWVGPGGSLSDLSALSQEDFSIFRRLAAVAPDHTLTAIEKFAELGNFGRRHTSDVDRLAQIVQSIAFDSPVFDRCVEILLKLWPMQSPGRGKPDFEQLKALFQLHHSGTMAPGTQRASIVSRLLSSPEPLQSVGLALLKEALKVKGFRNPTTFQFGTRTRTYGWRPSNIEEQREWYELFLGIAEPYALRDDDLGSSLRSSLGDAAVVWLYDPALTDHLTRLAPTYVGLDGWLPALKSTRDLLRRRNLDTVVRERAISLDELITPKDLRSKIIATLAMRNPLNYAKSFDNLDGFLEKAAKDAEDLGQELGKNVPLLLQLIPALIDGKIRGHAFSVGRGVGKEVAASSLLAPVIASIARDANPELLNSSFLCGLFAAWAQTDPAGTSRLLDQALVDPTIARWFPDLQISTQIDEQGAARLVRCLQLGYAPIEQFRTVALSLNPVSIASVVKILDALNSKGAPGDAIAIDLLHMVIVSSGSRSENECIALGQYSQRFLSSFNWENLPDDGENMEYEFEQIVSFAAKHSKNFDDVKAILINAVKYRERHPRYLPSVYGNYIAPVLRRYPNEALSSLLGLEDPDSDHPVSEMISRESIEDENRRQPAVISDESLIHWCSEDPEKRAAFCCRICPLQEPQEGALSAAQRLYILVTDKTSFIDGLADRGLEAGLSDQQIPTMQLITRILNSLPCMDHSPEATAIALANDRLQKRIFSWSEMLSRADRSRDETFE